MCAFRSRYYTPQNACVAIAGNYDSKHLHELLLQHFGNWEGGNCAEYPVEKTNAAPATLTKDKDVEQVHLCLGWSSCPLGDNDVYAIATFNSILGGSSSSRLFQRIREESGMAYTVYSAPAFYPHCGDLTVYAAVSPKNVKTVLEQIDDEIGRLLHDGISEEE